MFLVQVKEAVVIALRNAFDSNYPVGDFQNLPVSIEYPLAPEDYPGVWVGFQPSVPLRRGGIDNLSIPPPPTTIGKDLALYAWRFEGYTTYTFYALTSLQRDRLHDELVRSICFSLPNQTSAFRQEIENNPYIAMNMDFDQITVSGMSENHGTPWDTDEIIYEGTLSMNTIGEFYSDSPYGDLGILEEVIVRMQNTYDTTQIAIR